MNIKEFAKAVGLAPSTVSTAVGGSGRISPSTRAMVRQKMRELGYTPNLNGRRLSCGRSNLIAFCHTDNEPLSDLFSMQLARALVQPMLDSGYDLFHNLSGNAAQTYTMLRQRLQSSSVDAIILLGGEILPREYLEGLTADGHPCVVVGNKAVQGVPMVGSVVTGLRSGLKEVAAMLVGYGHHSIGYIDNDLHDECGDILCEELALLNTTLAQSNRIVVGRSPEEGAAAFRALMTQTRPPTAIVTRTDVLAVGVMREAREMGLRVPGDVSVVGHDDLAILPLVEPDLTSVRVDYDAMAIAITSVMAQLLRDPETMPSPREVPTLLIERKTVGPIPSPRH